MSNEIALSVILPAYLEEENLRILLPRLKQVLPKLTQAYEIIVVDTQTKMDHTSTVCTQNEVVYLNREKGNNFGDAVRSGIAHSKGKSVIFMDADGSHEPEFIEELWAFKNDFDVVVASRYVEGGITENSSILILQSKILNKIYAWLFRLPCKDISNSFKLYHGEKLRALKLRCDNFDIVEEILIKLNKNYAPLKIKEVPFVFRKRMFGMTKRNLLMFIMTYFFSIIRLFWQTRRD